MTGLKILLVLLSPVFTAVLSQGPERYTTVTAETGLEPRAPSSPCSCAEGKCGCCTGFLLGQFNIDIRQKGCLNVSYDPDDFAINMAMTFNNRVLYQNSFSGKNPRPVCVPLPRLPALRMCARFSNVYFAGRNIHACLSLEARWNGDAIFNRELECVRLGVDGVAIVSPEDGGGIPQTGGGGEEEVEDYDDPEQDDDDDDDEEDDDDDDDDDDDLRQIIP